MARGALYANNGDLLKAVGDFEAALNIRKNHKNAQKYLAETLMALAQRELQEGSIERTAEIYNKVVALQPHNQEARRNMSEILVMNGRELENDLKVTEALNAYVMALFHQEDNKEARCLIIDLKRRHEHLPIDEATLLQLEKDKDQKPKKRRSRRKRRRRAKKRKRDASISSSSNSPSISSHCSDDSTKCQGMGVRSKGMSQKGSKKKRNSQMDWTLNDLRRSMKPSKHNVERSPNSSFAFATDNIVSNISYMLSVNSRDTLCHSSNATPSVIDNSSSKALDTNIGKTESSADRDTLQGERENPVASTSTRSVPFRSPATSTLLSRYLEQRSTVSASQATSHSVKSIKTERIDPPNDTMNKSPSTTSVYLQNPRIGDAFFANAAEEISSHNMDDDYQNSTKYHNPAEKDDMHLKEKYGQGTQSSMIQVRTDLLDATKVSKKVPQSKPCINEGNFSGSESPNVSRDCEEKSGCYRTVSKAVIND